MIGKKIYDKQNFKEVSEEIYNNEFESINIISSFRIKKLSELSSLLNKKELKCFINNL